MNALVQVKKIGNTCNEVLDLSQQLADALDRSDEVSVNMLVSMRQEPIDKMVTADGALRQQLDALGEEDSKRLAYLLNGGEGETQEELALAAQVASNSRLLAKVTELDKVLNRKIKRMNS